MRKLLKKIFGLSKAEKEQLEAEQREKLCEEIKKKLYDETLSLSIRSCVEVVSNTQTELKNLTNKIIYLENKIHAQSLMIEGHTKRQKEFFYNLDNLWKLCKKTDKNTETIIKFLELLSIPAPQEKEPTETTPQNPSMIGVCKNCGDKFEKTHRLQKYCPTKYGKKDFCKYEYKFNNKKN